MDYIPKVKTRAYIPHPFDKNKYQKDYLIENTKISKNYNNTKFFISRNFGKDITNSTKNNLSHKSNSNKNRNDINISIKKKQSNSYIIAPNCNRKNYSNILGGYVSIKDYNYNNNKLNSNVTRDSRRRNQNKNNNMNSSIYNSLSYEINNENKSYSIKEKVYTNTNLASISIFNKKNNENKINKNSINIKPNKTNIISYLETKHNNIKNVNNIINIKNNNNLIKNNQSNINRNTLILSINNRMNKPKIEKRLEIKENNKENIGFLSNKIKTEYKIKIIQYDSKERTRRNNKSDIKSKASKYKEKPKKEEKIKFFDESKITNVQIPKDYINTIYYNLLIEEESPLILSLKQNQNFMKDQKEINQKMRTILVDWLIDVHFKFGFTDETLFLTISIIDRYVSVSQISRSKYQLLGITALMIACKHEEIDLPKIDDFIYITDHAYAKNDVLKMEYDILNKLNFSFLYPSPIKFFEYLSINFNFDKKMHLMGKYLMESFLLNAKNFKFKPSVISCACAYIVMKFFKIKNYYEAYNKKFFNINKGEFSESHVKECAKEICFLIDNINKTNYKSCIKKYSNPEKEKVAILIMNN